MKIKTYEDFIEFYNKIYYEELQKNIMSTKTQLGKDIILQKYNKDMKIAWQVLMDREIEFYERDGFIDVEYRKKAVKNKFARVKGPKGRPTKDCYESFNNTINFKVNDAQYSKLKNFCVANKVNISDALRAFVETL